MAALALSAAYMRCLAALSLSLSACNAAEWPGGTPGLRAILELELAFASTSSASPAPRSPPSAFLDVLRRASLASASPCSWSQSSIIARRVRFGTTCERFKRCFVLGSVR